MKMGNMCLSVMADLSISDLGLTFTIFRSIPSDVFLRKDVLKIWSKFTGEHLCRSAIYIKFPSLLKSHFGMGVLL